MGPHYQTPLRGLKTLSMSGKTRHLLEPLHRLTLPVTLDNTHLIGFDCFRHGTEFQDGLEISSYSTTHFISISVGAVPAQTTMSASQVTLAMALGDPPLLKQLFVDLITLVPREPVVVSFVANWRMKLPEELYFTMPNMESLRLFNVKLSDKFLQPDPRGPCAHMKFFPSGITSSHTYLAHQTSGGQIISLELFGDFPCLTPEMVDEVEGLVRNFDYHLRTNGEVHAGHPHYP